MRLFFVIKRRTPYERRIRDWVSDVCSADLTLLFAMIYKFRPQARVAWRDVWVGAGVTALLFEVGKFLIGLYMGKASIASSYRSEERRAGQAWVSTCRSRWSPYH